MSSCDRALMFVPVTGRRPLCPWKGREGYNTAILFLGQRGKQRRRDVKNVTHYITSLPSPKRHSWIWSEVSIDRRPKFPMSKFRLVWNAKKLWATLRKWQQNGRAVAICSDDSLYFSCVFLQVWRCFAEDPSHRGLWTLLKFIFFSSSNGHLITTFDFHLFPTGRLAFSFHSPTPWCLSVDFKSWIFIKFSNKCHHILLEGTLWRTCEAGDLYRWK